MDHRISQIFKELRNFPFRELTPKGEILIFSRPPGPSRRTEESGTGFSFCAVCFIFTDSFRDSGGAQHYGVPGFKLMVPDCTFRLGSTVVSLTGGELPSEALT